MKKRLISMMMFAVMLLSCVSAAAVDSLVPSEDKSASDVSIEEALPAVGESAEGDEETEEAEETVETEENVGATEETPTAPAEKPQASGALTSDKFTIYVNVPQPEGTLLPSTLRFNLFDEAGVWLGNRAVDITGTGDLVFEFPVATYEIGKIFKIIPTTGVNNINYNGVHFGIDKEFYVCTYAFRDETGALHIADYAHVTAAPLYDPVDPWVRQAEYEVNSKKLWSDTGYLIWVSKANFTVSVFLRENGRWNCIKYFKCSIGAPSTPTITGQYRYYQAQSKWQYDGYYVGPIMRFYGGYAIHSTLVNNNGTDRDGRVGKMISHGCVRVRPENMNWLSATVPLKTKIYVTNH